MKNRECMHDLNILLEQPVVGQAQVLFDRWQEKVLARFGIMKSLCKEKELQGRMLNDLLNHNYKKVKRHHQKWSRVISLLGCLIYLI